MCNRYKTYSCRLHRYSSLPGWWIKKDTVAIICTCKGYLPWYSSEGICTMVLILYSANCDGTLISPTSIVRANSDKYQGFVIKSNCDSDTGYLELLHRYGVSHCKYPIYSTKDLWYHVYNPTFNHQLLNG